MGELEGWPSRCGENLGAERAKMGEKQGRELDLGS